MNEMLAQLRAFPWTRFLRRRFPVHAEGWVAAQIPLFLALYLIEAQQPIDGLYVLASLIAALWLAGVLVAFAALLRFPWWLLAPFCLASMFVEGAFDALFQRPWPRNTVKRWYLSNALALWQAWRLKRQRRARMRARQRERERLQAALRGESVVSQLSTGKSPPPAETTPAKPSAKILSFPHPVECSVFEYAEVVWLGHYTFWCIAGFLLGWVWLAWGEDMGWLGAFVVMTVFVLLGTVTLFLPLAIALLAAISALLVGAGMKPVERWRVVQRARAVEAVKEAATPVFSASAETPARRSAGDWLLPLALGLLIGSAWGRED